MKLKKVGIMWECFCGNIVYGEKQPEECKKCKKLDSFTKLPAEMVEAPRKAAAWAMAPQSKPKRNSPVSVTSTILASIRTCLCTDPSTLSRKLPIRSRNLGRSVTRMLLPCLSTTILPVGERSLVTPASTSLHRSVSVEVLTVVDPPPPPPPPPELPPLDDPLDEPPELSLLHEVAHEPPQSVPSSLPFWEPSEQEVRVML